jgi:hypothetical protein
MVLIAQGNVPPKKGQADQNVLIADSLMDGITKDGRLNGVLWSLGDPMFRAAVSDGLIKNPAEYPSIRDALRVEKGIHAEYLLWVTATEKDGSIHADLALIKGSKLVWRNAQNATFQTAGRPDTNGTIMAVTTSWINMLDDGPLKDFAVTPVLATPPPDAGLLKPTPTTPTVPVDTTAKASDDVLLFRTVDGLLKNGHVSDAVQTLRDAVDAAPMDLDRRRRLCETLLVAGQPVLAAQEARRGAAVLPQGGVLRLIAIRAWLLAGQGDEAQNDLNELASHSANGTDPLLMAQVAMFQMNVSSAIEMLDGVIHAKPQGEDYYFRALAKGLQGDEAGVQADLPRIGSDDAGGRYPIATAILDASVKKVGDEVRNVLNQAGVKDASDVSDGLKFQIARATATLDFLQGAQPDSIHKHSHARRILAYNLLLQSLSSVQDYLQTHNDDSMSDARLNFGEALRNFAGARDDFLNESKGTASERTDSG